MKQFQVERNVELFTVIESDKKGKQEEEKKESFLLKKIKEIEEINLEMSCRNDEKMVLIK